MERKSLFMYSKFYLRYGLIVTFEISMPLNQNQYTLSS